MLARNHSFTEPYRSPPQSPSPSRMVQIALWLIAGAAIAVATVCLTAAAGVPPGFVYL
jgi:hypothetical protein